MRDIRGVISLPVVQPVVIVIPLSSETLNIATDSEESIVGATDSLWAWYFLILGHKQYPLLYVPAVVGSENKLYVRRSRLSYF